MLQRLRRAAARALREHECPPPARLEENCSLSRVRVSLTDHGRSMYLEVGLMNYLGLLLVSYYSSPCDRVQWRNWA